MEEQYEVRMGQTPVGKVTVIRQGLYVRVLCRCQTPAGQVYRLYAVCGSSRENLGVLVPEGDGLLLDKRIPAKRLDWGGCRFVLSCGGGEHHTDVSPNYPEEPFWYIHRHKAAFLHRQQTK